jgi:hypothetical protein
MDAIAHAAQQLQDQVDRSDRDLHGEVAIGFVFCTLSGLVLGVAGTLIVQVIAAHWPLLP